MYFEKKRICLDLGEKFFNEDDLNSEGLCFQKVIIHG